MFGKSDVESLLNTVSYDSDVIASLSDNKMVTIDIKQDGYKPIGIVSYRIISTGDYHTLINLYGFSFDSSNAYIRIAPSGKLTDVQFSIKLLYIKI